MAQCIIRKLCNVEIELQPLVQEVNFNVEYASVRQHLGGAYWSDTDKQVGKDGWKSLKRG